LKISLVSILSLTLLVVACGSPRPASAPLSNTNTPFIIGTPNAEPTIDAWDDRSIFKNGLAPSQQSVLEGLKGASVYHIEFNIADDLFHVTGREEVRYTNTETIPLNEVELRLFPNILGGSIDVTNILVDDNSVTPKYDLANSVMILPLTMPLAVGQSTVLKMDFTVMVPQEIERNYGLLAFYNNVLALAHAYPTIPVYDDEGWNAEIPSNQGDVTYTDASFYVVKIIAPKDVTVVTTGSEISHTTEGETQTLTVADGPARDFYLAASPDYQKVSETVDGITINSYAPADLQEGANATLEIAAKSLELYGQLYAPYPYTELDIVATPTLAGGIEYPGLVVVASRAYAAKDNASGATPKQLLEGIVAHEVGHQWFYNLVGDDQLDDPWLDEALAQYLTLEYFTSEYGPRGEQGFINSLENRWQSVERAKIPIGLPVTKYSDKEYGAIVYGRGPLFLVALRDKMGAAVFNELLKDYVTQLSWGIASPQFMQSLAEKHCSCDLGPLFKEWVYPPE
jgi:hypothetical protein